MLSMNSGGSNRSKRSRTKRSSVFTSTDDRIKFTLEKKRIKQKVKQATALLDQFLDDSAMEPIRESQRKANAHLKFGVDYKDLKAGRQFENLVRENNETIWLNPEKIKQEIAQTDSYKTDSVSCQVLKPIEAEHKRKESA